METFNQPPSKQGLLFFCAVFPFVYGAGLFITLLQHPGDWAHLPQRLFELLIMSTLFSSIFQIRDWGDGFTIIQISEQGINVIHRDQNRQTPHLIEWDAIKEINSKFAYPRWLKITKIDISCTKEGMSNPGGLPRVFPSGWVSIPLPWPVTKPEELKEAIFKNAPPDNPLVVFFRNHPDLE